MSHVSSAAPGSGTHSPTSQYRVVRKRNRVPLSCGPCRHRKLKCNRSHPCENCIKRDDPSSCTYVQGTDRKKSSRTQPVSKISDNMQDRIDRLESLVLTLMANGSQSIKPTTAIAGASGNSSTSSAQHTLDLEASGSGSIGAEDSDTEQVIKSLGILRVDNNKSYYISDAHWASVLHHISEVRSYFATLKFKMDEQAEKLKTTRPPSYTPGSAIFFGGMKPSSRAEIMSSFPSKHTADILITRYFSHREPSTHFIHRPTFQVEYDRHWENPSQTCVVWIGMVFAMMRLAMMSYHGEGDEPREFQGKSLDMAGSFRDLMAQCLIFAGYTKPYPYLIEALALHLHGDFCQSKEADVSIWVLTGVITRLAMRMGYHRDAKSFPNIVPFQGEMRRRVWAYVRQADLLLSSQFGLPPMTRSADSDTELPRSLYDTDFDEHCDELPPSRPLSEETPISYLIAKARLTDIFGRVVEQTSSIQGSSYETLMIIDTELRGAKDMIPDYLTVRPHEEHQTKSSYDLVSRLAVMTIYHKAQCMLHRQFLCRARESPRLAYSRRSCVDSAMELLRYQSIIHNESLSAGRQRNRQDHVTSLSSADFMLAASVICMDLYRGLQLQAAGRPSGDIYIWGRERRSEMWAAVQHSKEIWDKLRDETMDAFKASEMLGIMLNKLDMMSRGAEDSSANMTFELQDEKQNAAMTLGLLSSGVNTSNAKVAAFNNQEFNAEIPPVQGGGSMTTDIPGAASPFSSVFGQMPDMPLNLDWEAWDSYIQNPMNDFPNQLWPTMDQSQIPQSSQLRHNADGAHATSRSPIGFSPQIPSYDTNGMSPTGAYNNNSHHLPNGTL